MLPPIQFTPNISHDPTPRGRTQANNDATIANQNMPVAPRAIHCTIETAIFHCPSCAHTTFIPRSLSHHHTLKHRSPITTSIQWNCIDCLETFPSRDNLLVHIWTTHDHVPPVPPLPTSTPGCQYRDFVLPTTVTRFSCVECSASTQLSISSLTTA